MRLSDFINKECEKNARQSVGAPELIQRLVNGLRSEVSYAARKTYESVCADIARQVAAGNRNVTGFVVPNAGISVNNLPAEFENYGTQELREKIKKESDIRWVYSDMDGGGYLISFAREMATSQKYEAPTGFSSGGYRTTAAKMVKTCFWDEYEAELEKLLAAEGISFGFKIPVKVYTQKKGSETKKYIGFNEECDFRFYHWFVAQQVSLGLELHYSYKSK